MMNTYVMNDSMRRCRANVNQVIHFRLLFPGSLAVLAEAAQRTAPSAKKVKSYLWTDSLSVFCLVTCRDSLVFSTGLIMLISRRKEIRKLTFRALALRLSEFPPTKS